MRCPKSLEDSTKLPENGADNEVSTQPNPHAHEAIEAFLRFHRDEHPAPDYLDRYLEHGTSLETQANVHVDPTQHEAVAGKKNRWDTGSYQFWPIRIPTDSDTNPHVKECP